MEQLNRKAMQKLLSWKAQKHKKALCIAGARQIGKTTLIREFGRKNYEVFVEVNFILYKDSSAIFASGLDAKTIISNLTAYTKTQFLKGKTLIFLDEIQECPEARTAIKFLVEDGSFDYILSGSLLGVNYKHVPSYPVGFEEDYIMYPMDFEEFCMAAGVQDSTFKYLLDCYNELKPVSESIHKTMSDLFRLYVVIGGMPRVVSEYFHSSDIARVVAEQKDILSLYRQDIAQYAKSKDKAKIKMIFDAIPSELDEKNRRFILTDIDGHGRQNRYEDSFNWLCDAGVALPCYNTVAPQLPFKLNEKRNLFKLFMNDPGLLCAMSLENVQFEILRGNLEINSGSLLENTMASLFKASGFSLYYYDSKKHGEIDFVLQNESNVDLVEIKSGNNYKKHSALNNLLSVSEWSFGKATVFCKGNVEVSGRITYLPWYMSMFYKPKQITDSPAIYKIDLRALARVNTPGKPVVCI